MRYSRTSKFPEITVGGPEVREVLEVFKDLYRRPDPLALPSRAIVRPYTADAEYTNFRNNTPQCEEVETDDMTYGEIFLDEDRAIQAQLPSAVLYPITEAVYTNETLEYFDRLIPERISGYVPWIVSDLVLLLKKRLAFGRAPSLLEDLFQIYRAGYFSFGWSGVYPDDVRFLVFPATDA
jgi:hypothetical protein